MPKSHDSSRFVPISIHWLVIFIGFIALGSGWLGRFAPPSAAVLLPWAEIHVGAGLILAIAIVLRVLLLVFLRPHGVTDTRPLWLRLSSRAVVTLLYLALVVMIVSGYGQKALAGQAIEILGWRLPDPGVTEAGYAELLRLVHPIAAFAAAGAIGVHVVLETATWFWRRPAPIAEPAPPEVAEIPSGEQAAELVEARLAEPELEMRGEQTRLVTLREKQDRTVTAMANRLAGNLRFFGWIDLWLQFILALVIALLLVFASSGRAFSPSPAGFSDAIYWGWFGFMLLIPALLLAFYYVSASKKVERVPIDYLHHEKRIAFWFLWTGLLIGGLGIFVSFLGVALAIALLIVKTISQPPGIAITDPNNIIRALDVFVLVVNFMLLIAHFVGVLTALWLGFCASKARVGYMAIRSLAG